jgi:hypothetical protein
VWLAHFWSGWRSALIIVKPETVIAWHQKGFRRYWRWKSRHRVGRPAVSREVIDLIRKMSLVNPRWGAPRIHGELLKLGFELSQATVAKYRVRHRKPPSQTWRTFLRNHMKNMVAADFFVVPTVFFEVLLVFVILSHDRNFRLGGPIRPLHQSREINVSLRLLKKVPRFTRNSWYSRMAWQKLEIPLRIERARHSIRLACPRSADLRR